MAVAVTGLLFLLLGMDVGNAAGTDSREVGTNSAVVETDRPIGSGQEGTTVEADQVDPPDPLEEPVDTLPVVPGDLMEEAVEEARETAVALWSTFVGNLPQYIVASIVLFLAWLLTRVLRPLRRHARGHWERAQAITALGGIVIWLLAVGIAVSVLVGDIRALVGSLGLIGLALSWALQSPIESFTGWLMNGMRGYYRVGDRIAVGEILGDVFRIDFFTTTVWEIGGPERPGAFVSAEQPTGRLITFPNNEVLTGSIVNYTRDFPFVWDELTVPVANESDLAYAMEVLLGAAQRVIGDRMAAPSAAYEEILRERRLETTIPRSPRVFLSLAESWANLTVRYLVEARERRVWKSRLSLAAMEALDAPEHEGRIVSVYPRRQVMIIGPDGRPRHSPPDAGAPFGPERRD